MLKEELGILRSGQNTSQVIKSNKGKILRCLFEMILSAHVVP